MEQGFPNEKVVMPEDIQLTNDEQLESQVAEVEKLDFEEEPQNQVDVFNSEVKEEVEEDDLKNDGLKFVGIIFAILLVFIFLLPKLVKLIG